MTTAKIKLEYFKESGKYYAEGTQDVEVGKHWFQIAEDLRELLMTGFRPGLIQGRPDHFHILVTSDDYPSAYPLLFTIQSWSWPQFAGRITHGRS
jgi:hypothetical protein